MNIKDECLKMISLANHNLTQEFLEKCTALYIAEKLDMSRNLISSYLNQYCSEGILVKVGKRPVAYLIRRELALSESCGNQFASLAELKEAMATDDQQESIFNDLVGANGSLYTLLQSCCSAISYPGTGLSILLYGPTGTGKSFIAQKLYNYAKDNGIIHQNAKFVTANCSEYANNPEFFLTSLFGAVKGAYTGADSDRQGLLSLADGGVLFLDEVQSLSSECQEKLFLFMDKGIYHMVGDDSNIYKASVRLIFATTESPETALLKTLHRRIAMKVKVPSLAERPRNEKKELITTLIRIEERKIQKEIRITKRLYDILVAIDYSENIGQLSGVIRSCVASAYRKKDNIIIDIADMPIELLSECADAGMLTYYVDEDPLTIENLETEQKKEVRIYLFNRDLITLINEEKQLGKNEIWRRIQKRFKQYLDAVVFGEHTKKAELAVYRGVIEMTCRRLAGKYNVAFENNEIENLALLLQDYRLDAGTLSSLMSEFEKKISELNHLIGEIDGDGQPLAVDFAMMVSRSLGIETNDLFLLDFSIYLHVLSKKVDERETRCIILSHGYSTASSMAAAANHMTDSVLFDAIDMPTDVTVSEIDAKMVRYIENQKNLKDLIILVDMGSLEEINSRLPDYKSINFLIVNNVSMKMVLDVGFMMKQSFSIDKIRDAINENPYVPNTKFIENRRKQKAIVTVCATGIATAEKISNLLQDSLPEDTSILITECSFSDLKAEKENAGVFKKYDVLFIAGTLDPCVPGYDFISVEEMVDQDNDEKLNRVMNGVLAPDELTEFTEKMVKNFSLQNLLDYLTIINPKKIINYVEDIISYLKQNLDVSISSNTAVGLYIHISCLIERLITDRYITGYDNIEQFECDHQDFIQIVKKAFQNLEKNYCVKIPVSEIAYIYEYIYRYPTKTESDKSVEDSLF